MADLFDIGNLGDLLGAIEVADEASSEDAPAKEEAVEEEAVEEEAVEEEEVDEVIGHRVERCIEYQLVWRSHVNHRRASLTLPRHHFSRCMREQPLLLLDDRSFRPIDAGGVGLLQVASSRNRPVRGSSTAC